MELPLPAPIPNDQMILKLREALLAKGPESLEAAQWILLAASADPALLNSAREWYRLAQQIESRASGSPATTSPLPAANAQDVVLDLFQMVTQPGTDPKAIVRSLAQIALDFPEQFVGAMQMVEAAPKQNSTTATGPDAPMLTSPVLAWSAVAAGAGTYVTANNVALSARIDEWLTILHMQNVPRSEFVCLLALFGLLGGFVYGYSSYDGSWFPQFRQVGGQKVFILGVLGKALAGSIAAVVMLYLSKSPGTPAPTTIAVPTWHVTGSNLVAAFLAGLAGASWITMKRDWPLLAQSVSNALKLPASPEAARHMNGSSLKNILETVQQATPSTRK